jgi:hypothetical protein
VTLTFSESYPTAFSNLATESSRVTISINQTYPSIAIYTKSL